MKSQKAIAGLSTIIILAVLIAVVGVSAWRLSEASDSDDASHEHSRQTDDSHSDSATHAHDTYEVPEGVEAPTISGLAVTADAKDGWNVSFETSNFEFTPQNVNSDHVDGQGHAHLHIDGEKITRLYSHNYYIDHLDEGEHTIMVTLNTNDHKDYAVDGEVVMAMTTIVDSHHSN